jgi:hypothetical protein
MAIAKPEKGFPFDRVLDLVVVLVRMEP